MDLTKFVDTSLGAIQRVPGPHGYAYFAPAPLPRALDLDRSTVTLLSRADRALGRLSGTGRLLPNPHLLVQPYLATEAVASSQIEGTQASLTDLFAADVEDDEHGDVGEVRNYVAAFELGRRLLDELPLSLRLVRAMHERLLTDVRGGEKSPGEFRRTQNWIGPPGSSLLTAAFVPPPADAPMLDALADWERFLNEEHDLPPLVACALLHYQFETIHPFLDGNGRIGRLLIILYLLARGELDEPLLYLSPYFERDRPAYYDGLQRVREVGDLTGWLDYFLTGVAVQAQTAVNRAERLVDLHATYRDRLAGDRSRAGEVLDLLFVNPLITTKRIRSTLDVSNQSANALLGRLEEHGIVRRAGVSGRGGRIDWRAQEVLDLLTSST